MNISAPFKFRLLCQLAVFLFLVTTASANTDSLRQIWTDLDLPDSVRFNAIHEYYGINLFSQPDSVISLAGYHINLALEKTSEIERALALRNRAIAFNLKGDYDKSLPEMKKAAEIYTTLNDSLSLLGTNNNIALIYYYRVDYKASLKYFEECLAFYRKKKIKHFQPSLLMHIGQIHLAINNSDEALRYFRHSLDMGSELETENKLVTAILYQNIAKTNFGIKNYHRAIENNKIALNTFQPLRDRYYFADSHTLNAQIYQGLNQLDSAFYYIEKALLLHQEIGTDIFILKDKLILANLLLPTDITKATKLGEEVLQEAGGFRDHAMKIDLYELLHKCYKSKNEHQLSLTMLENYRMYSDSLRKDQDHISVIKNAIQSDYEEEIFSNQLLSQKEQAHLKRHQLRNTFLAVFMGLFVLLCVFFHFRSMEILQSKEKEELRNKISHLNQLEDTRYQLIQTEKMASLGQLAAGVAHEINNPVNFISSGIIGLKKTLEIYTDASKTKKTDELEKDMNDMISAIEEGAKRTSDIVKNLRLFSRDNSEHYLEVDIISGLEITFRLVFYKLNDGISLIKKFEKKSISIFCFPGQLYQAFINILLNASHAVKANGEIIVGVKEEGNHVIISISDSGPGIPNNEKQKIFEPFYTTKGIQEGTGLGLSISNEIIEKHQGSIEVRDNDPKGSTFVIRLPKRVNSLIIQ